MKRHLNIIACVIAISALTTSCESYEKRIAKLEKIATEYKASLGNNVTILAEVVDSTAQQIIYMKWVNVDESWDFVDKNMDRYGIIESHNYVTGTTENTTANWPKKDDYRYFGGFRLIKDRLFLNLWDGRYVTAVIYVNLRDNSIHEVAFPEQAEILDNEIKLTEMYVIHDAEYMCDIEYGRKEYVIKTSLTDAEYEAEAQLRAEDIRKTQEELAFQEQEWEMYDEPEDFIGDWEIYGDWEPDFIEMYDEPEDFIGDWLYGNWEYNGYDEWVGRYTMYVCISENNLRWGYNGKESYNGPYEINMEDRKIYFNRHNGFSTYINFDPRNQRLSDGDGHYFTKVNKSVGASSSNNYAGNTYGSNTRGNVLFRRDSDVIAYTSSHTFKNSMGNRISISFQGMSVNGSLLTNAPRVIYFNGSTATISVSSPYTGGGAMIISVDASRGTITDGSGDVFWMVN